MSPATKSCMMMSRQMPVPSSDGSPYMPVITYTIAWPSVITRPNNFWAPLNNARSLGESPTYDSNKKKQRLEVIEIRIFLLGNIFPIGINYDKEYKLVFLAIYFHQTVVRD